MHKYTQVAGSMTVPGFGVAARMFEWQEKHGTRTAGLLLSDRECASSRGRRAWASIVGLGWENV